jgi:hypothetical protein
MVCCPLTDQLKWITRIVRVSAQERSRCISVMSSRAAIPILFRYSLVGFSKKSSSFVHSMSASPTRIRMAVSRTIFTGADGRNGCLTDLGEAALGNAPGQSHGHSTSELWGSQRWPPVAVLWSRITVRLWD